MAVHDPTDPSHMSPEERLDELTTILARGMLRLLAVPDTPTTLANPADSSANCLDVPPELRLHVHSS